jgi:hypothetical protein
VALLPSRRIAGAATWLAWLATCLWSLPLQAQVLPSEPIALAGGRLLLGGDVTATFSCAIGGANEEARVCRNEAGFFNYTDYDRSALRMLRLAVNATLMATDRVAVLGEVRTENAEHPEAYALYLRVRPWVSRAFAIQAGRIPPTFGRFARRTYGSDNFLIGYPLAYQYLTSLRADALPASGDELLRMRGRGWRSSYSVGNPEPDTGLPLVNALRWDTGVQLHAAAGPLEGAVAVTTGTLGHPLVGDDNGGKQVSGRAAVQFGPALTLGASAARGPFLARTATNASGASDNGRYTQTAWGADAELSRDHYVIRFEGMVSAWTVPTLRDGGRLRAWSTSVEGRYRVWPGLYVAARGEHLGFSRLVGETRTDTWDAPVTRVEAGGGYSLQRNLLLKLTVQRNSRPSTRTRGTTLGALQVVYWL